MKCTIPEISWHNRDPVLSVDVQSGKEDDFYRLASGGTDSHVVVWHLRVKENGMAEVSFAADLQRHQRAVNTVRFSPSGELLASGDDESAIIVWKQKTEQDGPEATAGAGPEGGAEQWLLVRILRGHVEDVYDLSWSADSTCLVSGSVDNTAILWDVHRGRHTAILSDHKGFVQGVAWDPKNQYVATLSSDRTCRVFNLQTRKVACRISKAVLPAAAEGREAGPEARPLRLFHDDTLKSFFRRLAFSPDGELLFAPSGIVESPDTGRHGNATHVFVRRRLNRPVMYLPSPDHYTIAVRCCPVLFALRDGESMFALPYRVVLAVATQSSVVLYDTQQPEPFGIVSNIHYTRLTDLAWSSDGRVLVVASTDGFCSIVTFSKGELGEEYVPVKSSAVTTATEDTTVVKPVVTTSDDSRVGSSVAAPPVVQAAKETQNGGVRTKPETCSPESTRGKAVPQESKASDQPKKKPARRIQPITLTSRNSPSKSKGETAGQSNVPGSPQNKSISTSCDKLKNCEKSKDETLSHQSSVVEDSSPDDGGGMDVDCDDDIVEIISNKETSNQLQAQTDNETGVHSLESANDKVVHQDSEVGGKIAEEKAIRRIQPIKQTENNSPPKLKNATSCQPSKSLSTSCDKIENGEASKTDISSGESPVVKHDGPGENGVMDVYSDSTLVKISSEGAAPKLLDTSADIEKNLASVETTCEKSTTNAVSSSPDSKPKDSCAERVQSGAFPSETSSVAGSQTPEQVQPDGVAACDKVPEQKCLRVASEDVSSAKAGSVERMDVDEVVEADGGTSHKTSASDKVLCGSSTVGEKSECSDGSVADGSEKPERSEDTGGSVADSGSREADAVPEQGHKTPRKTAGAASEHPAGPETPPGPAVGGDAATPTKSPAPKAKKTPRRVQLITLSSPKSKRSLLQS
ncbi:chromatin assembly factor 1 subunit B [Bacillus rossius redtenbacheri]|uniref:chromatin assembly factor 1 subunit B n=1 Tax=Bacillus rossius redtenbacheri TaxID=93214 RepID=UPI002FDDEC0A